MVVIGNLSRARSAAVVTALLALLSACTQAPEKGRAGPESADACDAEPLPRFGPLCRSVVVGEQEFRYLLAEPTAEGQATAARPAIVVDPGGPGSSNVASAVELVSAIPERLRKSHVLIVLEEPWVLAEVSAACRQATISMYRAARASESVVEHGRRVRADCSLDKPDGEYGFSAEGYRDLLGRIFHDHNLIPAGFVGASFASARRTYMAPSFFPWSVLIRPFPVGAPSDLLLAERARIIGQQSSAAAVRRASASGEITRTLPVTEFDMASARIAAGQMATPLVNAADVARNSDGLWQRYGAAQVSPALLAYWDEVCDHGSEWPQRAWDGTAEDVLGVLSEFHAPCRNNEHAGSSAPVPAVDGLCVVIGRTDSVTPASLVRSTFAPLAIAVHVSEEAAHASTDGLLPCLDRVAPT